MSALIFCFVLFFWARKISCSERYIINKCCPEGEKLDFNLTCTSMSFEEYDEFSNSSLHDFDWFPIGAIVNASTLKIHQNDSDKYLQILRNEYDIKLEYKPDCGAGLWPEVAHFKIGLVELFHFIIYDNHTFRIHISKLNSLHDRDKDYIEFEKSDGAVNENEMELGKGTNTRFSIA